tara:strand:+ start:1273 stop:2379 length:1107 start_codon:yes stop_codon:yes gene_type:complete
MKKNIISGNGIDLIRLFKIIKFNISKIFLIGIISSIGGLIFSYGLEIKYKTSTTVIPQISSANKLENSGLESLANIAGFDINSSSSFNDIPPGLYPQIANSITFKKLLLESKIYLPTLDKNVTYKDYLINYYNPGLINKILKKIYSYTIDLPFIIKKSLYNNKELSNVNTNDKYESLSDEEIEIIDLIDKQVNIELFKREGYIEISTIIDDPLVSSNLTQNLFEILEDQIINFKINKSKEELKYLNEREKILKEEFSKLQIKLANFKDNNRVLKSNISQVELKNIEDEYQLTFNVYKQILSKIENQKLEIERNTPIFTIIKPILVPYLKEYPKRKNLIIYFFITSVIISISYFSLYDYLLDIISKLNI